MDLGHSYSTVWGVFGLCCWVYIHEVSPETKAERYNSSICLSVALLHVDPVSSLHFGAVISLLSNVNVHLSPSLLHLNQPHHHHWPLTHGHWQCGVHSQLQPHSSERLSPVYPQAHWGEGSGGKGHHCSRPVQHTNQHVLTGRHHGRHRRPVAGQGTRQVRSHNQTNPLQSFMHSIHSQSWHHITLIKSCVGKLKGWFTQITKNILSHYWDMEIVLVLCIKVLRCPHPQYNVGERNFVCATRSIKVTFHQRYTPHKNVYSSTEQQEHQFLYRRC